MPANSNQIPITSFFYVDLKDSTIRLIIGMKKFPLALLLLLFFPQIGCIEEFYPNLGKVEDMLVIDGNIIKGNKIQQVRISKSTSVYASEFIPVTGCKVWVIDNVGNEFFFHEVKEGIYQAEISDEYISFNNSFKLRVTTPNENEYESGFEPILETSPIDSIYYEIESNQTSSQTSDGGLQFYIDVKAPEGASKNYKWTLTETYEERSDYKIDGFFYKNADSIVTYKSPIDSLRFCWNTEEVKGVYTSSTQNLTVNEKKKIPLNYIPGDDKRIDKKYSLLIKQYALDDAAYQYWNQNQVETQESGGLYQTQPSQTKSNIQNINNPNEKVIGYFWTGAFTEKRIFFSGPLKGYFYYDNCILDTLYPGVGIGKDSYLVAIRKENDSVLLWGFFRKEVCIDCKEGGGTIKKPDFWE